MIRIDNREKDSRIRSATSFFEKMDYSCKVEQLAVGDYVFHDRICFEYKTASDMIGSIMDGRVFRQARNMKQYEYSYIIVVGNVAKTINDRNKKAYWRKYPSKNSFTVYSWLGALARLSTYSQVIVLDNDQQCWKFMDSIVSKILKDNNDVKMVDKPQNGLINPVASYLSCIYINDSQRLPTATAVRITEEYGLETVSQLTSLTKKDLLKVRGIGEKTADAIVEAIR
jgi:ERCC4-type nuclease